MTERNVDREATVKGTIYFASDDAKRHRLYREGQQVTITLVGCKAMWLARDFVQIDFDSTGRNYIHLSVSH